ncbi:calcium-binding protein [Mesorhizobium kowhaii]|uniref:calcium-binding protein n=1 Tax=Mesorhizobium kowhaii TaxID=1300272 RepID=UPI000DAF1E0B|nr:calcium-binding protein [Mesorhizobium kowhaii]
MTIGRIGQDFIVNSTAINVQYTPVITALADGRFVATWSSTDTGDGDGYCVRARIYNADGSAAGSDFIVNSTATSNQSSPAITALADGRFAATWQSGDTGDGDDDCMRARIYNADGSAAGSDFIVNSTATGFQTSPAITALADGRFVATWESYDTGDGAGSCIRAHIYNADGSAAGSDFIVNSTAANNQVSPAITALADGRFVTTWQSYDPGDGSSSCIRARIYNANGSAAGSDFIVNSTATSNQYDPAITALADGRFVATWQSYDPGDGDGTCIRARIYNANGSAAGSDFIVNSTATGNQYSPAITVLADGRFVAAWNSLDTGDGDGSCIRARVYNADGSAAGSDFIVNSTATGLQYDPAITALADGRFVATWESVDTGDGSGSCIRAQIFDPTVFVGTAGKDIWQGSNVFADHINGGTSADTLSGLGGDDTISGDAGNDMLDGGAGSDKLFGGAHNDTLNGGAGADLMSGGTGDDTYWVDNAGDHVIELNGQGIDNVQSTVSFNLSGQELENLALRTGASINGTGNSIANVITGNSGVNILIGLGGNDTLDGKEGADTMQGGIGNDTYYVDNAGDHVVESNGQGADNVQAYVSFNLSGQELENLQLRSAASINGTGNSIANIINGNSGNNIIDGLLGADTMSGAQGNDTYYVDNAGDHVIEVNGQGTDNVQAYVSFNLSGQELENLQLRSAASINGTGNSIANIITGNSGANVINGLGGNDTLSGSTGHDSFVFTSALNASTNVDHITDFSVVDDTIQVDNAIFAALGGNGTLTAAQFVKNTTGLAGDGNDHIIYETDTGWLTYDSNGNAAGGSTHFATLAANLALTNADFVVI